METKHTPGPWRHVVYYGDDRILYKDSDGSERILMQDAEYYPSCPSNSADWALIAAAPDMAADLEAGIELIAGDLTGPEWKEACLAWLKRARGTLSKAIGA